MRRLSGPAGMLGLKLLGMRFERGKGGSHPSPTMNRLSISLLASVALVSSLHAENWPQFRGPDGSAAAPEGANIPTEWSAKKNVKWKRALPGPGSSSPIFWGNKLFVTCYSGYGTDKKEIGEAKDLGRHLVCIDRSNGDVLWTKSIEVENKEDPYRGYLMEHGYASATPATRWPWCCRPCPASPISWSAMSPRRADATIRRNTTPWWRPANRSPPACWRCA